MKKFSDIKKESKKVRRIFEAEGDANLPSNYKDMSKEELLALMSGKKEESEETEDVKDEEKTEINSDYVSILSITKTSNFG